MTGTNRREFIRFLALLAAGTAALPQQIEAFEKYYAANTPLTDGELIAIDLIRFSGMATKSLPILCNFYRNDQEQMSFGLNLFGGIMQWIAAPDAKIVTFTEDFYWDLKPQGDFEPEFLVGSISYIDSKYVRKNIRVTKLRGSLIDP